MIQMSNITIEIYTDGLDSITMKITPSNRRWGGSCEAIYHKKLSLLEVSSEVVPLTWRGSTLEKALDELNAYLR